MKKLLIASDCFLPRWDGIARFLNEIIPRLEDHYEITVIAPKFEGEFECYIDTKVTRFPLTNIMIADYPIPKPSYKSVYHHVKESDIVWVQTTGPIGTFAIFAAKRQKKKIVAYIHALEWELFPRSITAMQPIKWAVRKSSSFLARYLYNNCDLLLVPSQGIAELLGKKGIRTKKRIIHLGTDTKEFSPPNNKTDAKRELGIDPEKIVIGFAGRIGLEKDLSTLYRAFLRINRKHGNTLLFIGGQDLAGVTKHFKNKKVKLMGATNKMSQYLKSMDIYVLPSLTETSSLSTMEAMSCGLAVVASQVGSVKEYIKEGFNGMLFEKGNSYQLSKKLEILINDPITRKRLGENARRTIIGKFTWEKTAEQINEELDKI